MIQRFKWKSTWDSLDPLSLPSLQRVCKSCKTNSFDCSGTSSKEAPFLPIFFKGFSKSCSVLGRFEISEKRNSFILSALTQVSGCANNFFRSYFFWTAFQIQSSTDALWLIWLVIHKYRISVLWLPVFDLQCRFYTPHSRPLSIFSGPLDCGVRNSSSWFIRNVSAWIAESGCLSVWGDFEIAPPDALNFAMKSLHPKL